VKDVVRSLDANMPMLHTMTYEDYYLNKAVKGPGIAVNLVASMGAVGLVLAIAGLYGVVAYNVSRRTREIGIRMALGAAGSDVLRLVMGKGLVLVTIGAAIGVVMGFGVEQMMNSMLFNAGGIDRHRLHHSGAVAVRGDHAGGLCSRASRLAHRTDTSAALRVAHY